MFPYFIIILFLFFVHFQIPLIADLPVGQNLQDHCAAILPSVLTDKNIQTLEKRFINESNVQAYLESRTGYTKYNDLFFK